MNEAYLKARLVKAMKARLPRSYPLRIEDKFKEGIPDLAWIYRATNRTLWIEVKYDRPGARAKVTPMQRKVLRRVGGVLVTYYNTTNEGNRRVEVEDGRDTWTFDGHDHAGVSDHLAERLELE